YRLAAAEGTVLVDERIETDSDDIAAMVFDPPQRAAELSLQEGEELDLVLTHPLEPGGLMVHALLGVEEPSLGEAEALEQAVAAAREADVAVVVVGTTEKIESEGVDRTTLALPGRQDELVRAVAAAKRRTIVAVNSGGPVVLPWRDEVPAVLLTWFGGQEFGAALADVLLGRREPGGRLPTTWPAREEDVPVMSTRPEGGRLEYAEGLHIGYRAWARADAEPAYPFGHGLGYTTWSYEAIDASPEQVGVRVRNTGSRPGREVVQAYLSRPESGVERPALWLAGFAAVEAGPGEEAEAVVALGPRAFRHWGSNGWEVEPGPFTLRVGRSASNLPLEAEVSPPGERVEVPRAESRGSGRMKTQQERQADKRAQKLEEMQEQIRRGDLVVRQMTAEERERNQPRPPKPKRR
ncbi:MAG: glycoside hydrolase family 3 C-terminal domain-containing protein, partial [Gaiellaceae bacterium]